MDQRAIDIEKKVRAGEWVSNEDYLYLLRNNENAFWAFLIQNNPGNVNNTLRHTLKEPYTELTFNPNKVSIARQIEMMIAKNEAAELMEVLKNFQLKTETLDPEFVEQFNKEFL